MNLKYVCLWALFCMPCAAQTSSAPVPTTGPHPDVSAAQVQRVVLEDRGTRIEEVRVRGQVQRILVTPKVGINQSYEVLTRSTPQESFEGTGGARSSAGRRVWNVLDF